MKVGEKGLKMSSGEVRHFKSEQARNHFERVAQAYKHGWRPSKEADDGAEPEWWEKLRDTPLSADEFGALEEKSPPGLEDLVLKLKDKDSVDNPYAVAWSVYNKQQGEEVQAPPVGEPMREQCACQRQECQECSQREANSIMALGQLARKGMNESFSPDQPRDENGRFASGGGSSGTHDDDDADTSDEGPGDCPGCGGELNVLGSLGSREHSRCRNCGMDYSRETKPPKASRSKKAESDLPAHGPHFVEAGDSFFSTCERDEHGWCMGSGGASDAGTARGVVEKPTWEWTAVDNIEKAEQIARYRAQMDRPKNVPYPDGTSLVLQDADELELLAARDYHAAAPLGGAYEAKYVAAIDAELAARRLTPQPGRGYVEKLDDGTFQVWAPSPTAETGYIRQGQPWKTLNDAARDAAEFDVATFEAPKPGGRTDAAALHDKLLAELQSQQRTTPGGIDTKSIELAAQAQAAAQRSQDAAFEAPKFQKRHFEMVAGILNTLPPDTVEAVLPAFSQAVGATNPNFDPERFAKAARSGELYRPSGRTAKLTRQDFNLLADTIADAPDEHRDQLATTFADGLASTNPNFDRDRFLKRARREAGVPDVGIAAFSPFREAGGASTPPGGVPQVVLITAGPGNRHDGNFYPPDVLERDAEVFNGIKCFFNHPGAMDEQNRPEREVEGVAGWFTNIRTTPLDGTTAVTGNIRYMADLANTLTEGGVRARGMIESAIRYNREFPGNSKVLLGFSINANGPSHVESASMLANRYPQFREALMARETWNVVDAIESAQSVDLVTFPARGGRVLGLREAEDEMWSTKWRTRFTESSPGVGMALLYDRLRDVPKDRDAVRDCLFGTRRMIEAFAAQAAAQPPPPPGQGEDARPVLEDLRLKAQEAENTGDAMKVRVLIDALNAFLNDQLGVAGQPAEAGGAAGEAGNGEVANGEAGGNHIHVHLHDHERDQAGPAGRTPGEEPGGEKPDGDEGGAVAAKGSDNDGDEGQPGGPEKTLSDTGNVEAVPKGGEQAEGQPQDGQQQASDGEGETGQPFDCPNCGFKGVAKKKRPAFLSPAGQREASMNRQSADSALRESVGNKPPQASAENAPLTESERTELTRLRVETRQRLREARAAEEIVKAASDNGLQEDELGDVLKVGDLTPFHESQWPALINMAVRAVTQTTRPYVGASEIAQPSPGNGRPKRESARNFFESAYGIEPGSGEKN